MSKTRILVVEDDAISANQIRRFVDDSGKYEITSITSSGEEAVRLAGVDKPSIVLMDIVLEKEMDGIEASRIIHERFDIPIVFLTACSDDAHIDRAVHTSPFGYMLKPFSARELLMTIEIALYRHRMEAERERLIKEVEETLTNVKRLKGLVPICASCKKVRGDHGFWKGIETYLEEETGADFTHSICPECAERLYKKNQRE